MKTLALAALFLALAAATAAADSLTVARREIVTARRTAAIAIDGLLTETEWQNAPAESGFVQSDPDQGAPPTYRTEARVLYDDDAIYVAARMYDAHPDSIVAHLCRRDEWSHSDEFTVYLDPYHDRRSGYYFIISAAGILRDGVQYNDDWNDDTWDGVWQGKAHVDSLGWTAEMRIPYSQLRFKKSDQYRWGVDFSRNLARRNESDLLVFTPRNQSGFVSRFPDLVGISKISPARAIQITPYTTSRGEFLQHDPGDPFRHGGKFVPEAGADLKTAVGSKLTLNATVNPDFGQVEVDPAVVNLSDVESTFNEKRPFFVEGSNNYDFGFGGANNYMGFNWPGPSFFYSRRIGRSPEVSPSNYDFADIPTGTRILGAAKLTGKIAGDWNLGVLQAVTAREMADIDSSGTRSKAEVEPLTSYSVTRAQRDFHGGRQGLGILSTAAVRRFDDPRLATFLNHRAFLTGLDGWTFLDKGQRWVVTGWTARTDLAGSADRITAVQTGPAHYLQEPDNQNWHVDSSATSLTGYAGRFTVNKQKGNVQFNSAVGFVNPHFDTNDLGITSRTDVVNAHISSGYRWSTPNKWRRSANFNAALFGSTDFDGNVIRPGIWTNGGLVFSNYWTFFPNFSYNPASLNDRLTRGGPLVKAPASYNGGFFGDTDTRKRFYYWFEWDFASSRSGGWDNGFYPGVTWKPEPNISFSFSPNIDRNHQDSQWVGSVADPGATGTFGHRYVFAQLDQTTISAGIRLNWAFTPNLSLQTYIQPLISSGNYFGYKQLAKARTYQFDPVGNGVPQYDAATDKIDLGDGNGPHNPDFNFTSLRGNAILRWEYMPGSTLFLVWTQDRRDYLTDGQTNGEFEFGSGFSRMVDQRPNNIFMAKVTYYLSL